LNHPGDSRPRRTIVCPAAAGQQDHEPANSTARGGLSDEHLHRVSSIVPRVTEVGTLRRAGQDVGHYNAITRRMEDAYRWFGCAIPGHSGDSHSGDMNRLWSFGQFRRAAGLSGAEGSSGDTIPRVPSSGVPGTQYLIPAFSSSAFAWFWFWAGFLGFQNAGDYSPAYLALQQYVRLPLALLAPQVRLRCRLPRDFHGRAAGVGRLFVRWRLLGSHGAVD